MAALTLIIVLAVLVPYLGLPSPSETDLSSRLEPPAWMIGGHGDHLLGTDHLGRDVLARIIHGARVSLAIAVIVILISAAVGCTVGLLSGYNGGLIDSASMRVVDITLSLPLVLLAIVFAVVFGASVVGLVFILSAILWAQYARIVRGETLVLRQREFINAAITLGYKDRRVLTRHILPNLMHTVVVIATLQVGTVILMESSLSFLGVGVPASVPTWGRIIADGRAYIGNGWWAPLFAGAVLAAVIICTNLLGDWLRDRFDPQMTRREIQGVF